MSELKLHRFIILLYKRVEKGLTALELSEYTELFEELEAEQESATAKAI